jgi:hypothetical protein
MVWHTTPAPASETALEELVNAVHAWFFSHQWMHHKRYAPRTVVVEKSDEWLRRPICKSAGDDNERASRNAHRVARRATAYHIGLLERTASITSELGYRIAMTTSGDLRTYPHHGSRLEACSRV